MRGDMSSQPILVDHALSRQREDSPAPPPVSPAVIAAAPVHKRAWMDRLYAVLTAIGLGFINPILRLCQGENPRLQLLELWRQLGIPLTAIAIFLFGWSQVSARIETSTARKNPSCACDM